MAPWKFGDVFWKPSSLGFYVKLAGSTQLLYPHMVHGTGEYVSPFTIDFKPNAGKYKHMGRDYKMPLDKDLYEQISIVWNVSQRFCCRCSI